MANELSKELKKQIFGQESDDPFLTLVTLSSGDNEFRLVNNSVDIVSRGETYTAFPMKITFPQEDGETSRQFQMEFDNASLYLIQAIRSATEKFNCKIEMILASMPDVVQMEVPSLVIQSITYSGTKVTAVVVLDSFLVVGLTSERYTPSLYPGLF